MKVKLRLLVANKLRDSKVKKYRLIKVKPVVVPKVKKYTLISTIWVLGN